MLAFAMLLCFAACGEKKEQKDDKAEQNQSIYDNLAGEYSDSYSGRAMMDLTSVSGGVKALVSWGSSASEHDAWEFTLKVGEGDTLCYDDGVHSRVTTDLNGKDTTDIIAKNESGFFTLNQKGDLLWNGAADEDCRECVFEKIE